MAFPSHPQERIDKALVFLAHPGNWLAGPRTPFSITHNLTVVPNTTYQYELLLLLEANSYTVTEQSS